MSHREFDPYLMREIYNYSSSKIEIKGSVMIPDLCARLSQYTQDEIVDVLSDLEHKEIIKSRNHMAFGPGRQYLKWRDEMTPPNVSSSPTINIGAVHGPAHFGQGDINITNNDAEALIKLVQELSKSTASKPLGDKIKSFLTGALGVGSNATTIIQGLAQIGALL